MSLRLLHIILPRRHRDELKHAVEHIDADKRWCTDLEDELQLTTVLIRAAEVETLTDDLNERFSAIDRYRVVSLPVQATRPRLPDPPKKAAPNADGGSDEQPGSDPADETASRRKPLLERISREELYEQIAASASPSPLFALMVVLSTIVASVGMMRDSAAVIIGAMVIAPLLGPNMAMAFATTLGDKRLIRRSLLCNGLGLAIALAMSTAAGAVLAVDTDVPELAARADVHLADIALALASGAAGALAFTAGASATLVGVMVAVALLPPTAAAGLMLGSGSVPEFVGAATLLLVNVVCVNLAATVTFLVQGVRPGTWWTEQTARNATRRALLIWIGLLVLLAALLAFAA